MEWILKNELLRLLLMTEVIRLQLIRGNNKSNRLVSQCWDLVALNSPFI